MDNTIFLTEDGSHSLISSKFGEAYHSRYGAIEESQHVFIRAGLEWIIKNQKDQLNILEIGFGTGLNCLLSLDYLLNKGLKIQCFYHGLEAYRVSPSQAQQLNYTKILNLGHLENTFMQMHEKNSIIHSAQNMNFTFEKIEKKFETYNYPENFYDLVYFDAFAPSIQAHLWESEFQSRIFQTIKKNGVLVSYCAKGSFKRTLKALSYQLHSLPGPGKKREMTRAVK